MSHSAYQTLQKKLLSSTRTTDVMCYIFSLECQQFFSSLAISTFSMCCSLVLRITILRWLFIPDTQSSFNFLESGPFKFFLCFWCYAFLCDSMSSKIVEDFKPFQNCSCSCEKIFCCYCI